MSKPQVVIVGGGFGGLALAQNLKNADVEITLIDRTNHSLFQPLLYQVATAALSPGDIAVPLRSIFRKQKNINILLNEAIHIDRKQRLVYLKSKDAIRYDYLVLAVGAEPTYFAHPEWVRDAPGLKTMSDALRIREKVLLAFEMAESVKDPVEKERCLTFVIVGGGPTGVELAGAIAEISQKTLQLEYPKLANERINIYLLDGGDRLLSAFTPDLSERAKQDLEKMGVKVFLNTRVEDITDSFVVANGKTIATHTVIWGAGNMASPLLKTLETETDRMGRVVVGEDLSLSDDPTIFVIGDAANRVENGQPLPGVAQVAMQMGKYLAKVIGEKQPKEWRKPFKYNDLGSMATIGRAKAIGIISGVKMTGLIAWLAWCFVHVMSLITYRNRIRVMAEWVWFYLTFNPGARIIYWQSRHKERRRPN